MAISPLPLLIALLAVGIGSSMRSLRLPAPAFVPAERVPPEALPRPLPFGRGAFAGFAGNTTQLRDHAKVLFAGSIHGSESVAIQHWDGSLWMLDKWGFVYRADGAAAGGGQEGSSAPQRVAYVGPGRSLGFHFDTSGRLLICNSLQGLQLLDLATGTLETLANRVSDDSPLAPGSLISYANDLDVASNGDVYFSDSTDIPPALNSHPSEGGWYDTMRSYLLQAFRGRPTGRLLRWSAADGRTHMLADGFWYANGVALSRDESFTLVAETSSMRVWKVHLQGPKAGSREVFIDHLPAFPDGISRASDGGFWLALVIPDSPILRAILAHPAARWALAWLPQGLLPLPPALGCVVKLSGAGEVQAVLLDPPGPGNRVSSAAAAEEHEGRLFLGNLGGSGISILSLADVGLG